MSHDNAADGIDALITLLDAANDIKLLPRTGWLLAGVSHAESVADHSCAVALLALALAESINREPATQGIVETLDVAQVLRIALLHDLAESIVTDLPLRTSILIGADVKHAAERAAFATLTEGLASASEWRALWEMYDSGSTPEARLVRDADKLEMAHQALRYAASGNRNLAEFWQAHRQATEWAFPLSAQLHARLLQNART